MKTNYLETSFSGDSNSLGTLAKSGFQRGAAKFKALLMGLAMLAVFFQANAQPFTIVGTGNGSNSNTGYPAPFGNWYYGAKHQFFVTAAEMTAAGIQAGGMISSIGFNVLNTNAAVAHQGFQMQVYTTASVDPLISAFVASPPAPVAVSTPSTIAPTVGWIQIGFPSFTWNGTDNLVIETCFYNSSGYTYNYSTEWQSNLTGSTIKSRYVYQDLQPAICSQPGTSASSTTRPLMRFEWVPGVPCAGTPGANSVVTPTFAICPNSTALVSLANTYTVGGITYQWQSSTVSPVGPFVAVPGGTMSSLTTPSLNVLTYFSAIITCSTTNGSVTATAGSVMVQPTTTNSVPYFEGFEGLSGANKLPNCSWAATNMPAVCQTYTSVQNQTRFPRTGNNYASFYYSPAQNNSFYTNGIWMDAGITYSASMYYVTDYYGYNTWNLKMWVGPNQSTVNANLVATNAIASSPSYKLLSNTFTVPTSGYYYVGINATSNGACCAYYLSWDDLKIEVPCQLNAPAVAITANTQTICSGQSVNLSATGAVSYLWNNGATTSAITVTPNFNTTYYVTGTAASGCTASTSQNIVVNNSPVVSAVASQPTICAGKSTNLVAFGASSYLWNNNSTAGNIVVSPSVTTSYTVIGTNAAGCTGNGVVNVVVNPNPAVTISSSNANNLACVGDITTLTGNGFNLQTYQWSTNNQVMIGSPITVSPNGSTTYTLLATNNNGCQGTSTYQLNVTECVGLKDVSTTQSGIKLYPNPNNGEFVVEVHNKLINEVQVSDLTGRIIFSSSTKSEKIQIDLSSYSKGIYYVKVSSENGSEVIKVVKQ